MERISFSCSAYAELAGKFLENSRQGVRLKTAMTQVEAVLQMLQPGFNVQSIAAKCRNKSNPWFRRGTLFGAHRRVARAGSRNDAAGFATALIADKAVPATRKQFVDLRGQSTSGCGSGTA
jgi:hypothetical protein